jgi:hypothetical protein
MSAEIFDTRYLSFIDFSSEVPSHRVPWRPPRFSEDELLESWISLRDYANELRRREE